MSETDFETPLASDEYFKAGFMADSHTGNESAWTLTRDVAVAMQWAEAEPEFPVTRVRLLPAGAAGEGGPSEQAVANAWAEAQHDLMDISDWSDLAPDEQTLVMRMVARFALPTPAREPVAWKIIDERFTSGGILTQDRAEMEQLAKNPSALIVPLAPLMDPPAAPTAERSEGAGVADIVKLYAMRDNAELDAVLADAVRRGLKSVEVPNGILGTIRYELPPTPEAGTVTEEVSAFLSTVGCGDHSCLFVKPQGMGTNGSCRCSRKPGFPERVARLVNALAGRRGA